MATYYVDVAVGNDSNAGTSPGAGNAWASIGQAWSVMTATGDICYVKASGDYSIGSTLTWSNTDGAFRIARTIGYTSTITDGGRITIKATANITGISMTGYGMSLENAVIDANGFTGRGVSLTSYGNRLYNCIIQGWTNEGVRCEGTAGVGLIRCKVTGITGGSAAVNNANGPCYIHGCSIIGNSVPGLATSSGAALTLLRSLIANNSGASSDGITCQTPDLSASNNVFYNNGRDGIRFQYDVGNFLMNNIFYGNGGYGLYYPASSILRPFENYNAFGANTSGAYNNISAGANDITLSGDPFTNAAGNDFTLNNIVGAGRALRSVGFPETILEFSQQNYLDLGIFQHLEVSSAGFNIFGTNFKTGGGM